MFGRKLAVALLVLLSALCEAGEMLVEALLFQLHEVGFAKLVNCQGERRKRVSLCSRASIPSCRPQSLAVLDTSPVRGTASEPSQ